MSTGIELGRVMNAFKAPENCGRYFVGPGIIAAQYLVNQMPQGELRKFGLDRFLVVGRPDPMQSIISFGPFGSKVDAPELFKRLDQLFEIGRLPESKHAEAAIAMPDVGSSPHHVSVLTLFGALKASGAVLSSNIVSLFSKSDGTVLSGRDTVAGIGKLEATFEQGDVRLTCGAEVVCRLTRHEDGTHSPITIGRLGERMIFEASLPTHGFAMMGHRVLKNGLRDILSPLVDGDAPFFISPGSDSLLAGVRGALKKSHLEEAYEAFGIHEDGTVSLPG